jgi:hypothetical protein
MPPSGYSKRQSHYVDELLRSCAEALAAEALDLELPFIAALDRELAHIGHYLGEGHATFAQVAILRLTEAFYRNVRDRKPCGKEQYWAAVALATQDLESEMLAIHVPSEV